MTIIPKISKNRFFHLENIFVILTLITGLILAIITPPDQVPDEESHFRAVYTYSHGLINSPLVTMPVNLYTAIKYYHSPPTSDSFLDFNTFIKRYFEVIDFSQVGQFASHIYYSPLVYIPQIIGLSFGLAMNMPYFQFFLAGRITSLFFYCICGYLFLRYFPGPKTSLFVLLTMPMAI